MNRYIDADEYEKRIKPYDTEDKMDKALYNFAHNILICCSTAEVKPIVYGEWLYTGDMFNDGELVCSKCGHKIDVADKNNFCPNCGATMKKKSEE